MEIPFHHPIPHPTYHAYFLIILRKINGEFRLIRAGIFSERYITLEDTTNTVTAEILHTSSSVDYADAERKLLYKMHHYGYDTLFDLKIFKHPSIPESLSSV